MSAFNTIIATLEYRGIINREEGELLVDHINNHPQSSNLGDAVETVTKILTGEVTAPESTGGVLEAAKPQTDKATQSKTTKKK